MASSTQHSSTPYIAAISLAALCGLAVTVAGIMNLRSFSGLAASISGDESIMMPKEHGTCVSSPQSQLRWSSTPSDFASTADRICCYNRHWAERSTYWESTTFLSEESSADHHPVTFYDSITGRPLFIAPQGRSWSEFVEESRAHGWPSFRDEEVVKENVRVLSDGETVSTNGTHLGHNLPDSKGNRYCINLVCIAGNAHGTK